MMDTRNRWQRMNDARYENKPLTKAELNIVKTRLGETSVDKFNRLSSMGGHTMRHPRTSEIIRMKTSDIVPTKQMPRTKLAVAQPIQYINANLTKDGKLEVDISTKPNKRHKWKSIWYSKHSRRQ